MKNKKLSDYRNIPSSDLKELMKSEMVAIKGGDCDNCESGCQSCQPGGATEACVSCYSGGKKLPALN